MIPRGRSVGKSETSATRAYSLTKQHLRSIAFQVRLSKD
jgi:hypothetical protein